MVLPKKMISLSRGGRLAAQGAAGSVYPGKGEYLIENKTPMKTSMYKTDERGRFVGREDRTDCRMRPAGLHGIVDCAATGERRGWLARWMLCGWIWLAGLGSCTGIPAQEEGGSGKESSEWKASTLFYCVDAPLKTGMQRLESAMGLNVCLDARSESEWYALRKRYLPEYSVFRMDDSWVIGEGHNCWEFRPVDEQRLDEAGAVWEIYNNFKHSIGRIVHSDDTYMCYLHWKDHSYSFEAVWKCTIGTEADALVLTVEGGGKVMWNEWDAQMAIEYTIGDALVGAVRQPVVGSVSIESRKPRPEEIEEARGTRTSPVPPDRSVYGAAEVVYEPDGWIVCRFGKETYRWKRR